MKFSAVEIHLCKGTLRNRTEQDGKEGPHDARPDVADAVLSGRLLVDRHFGGFGDAHGERGVLDQDRMTPVVRDALPIAHDRTHLIDGLYERTLSTFWNRHSAASAIGRLARLR